MKIAFIVVLFWSGVCLVILWLNYRFPRNRIVKRPASGEFVKDGPDTYTLSETDGDLFPGTGEAFSAAMQNPAAA